MINHIRTLLRNRNGGGYQAGQLGAEYVPPTYKEIALPGSLQSVRRLLFGATPDDSFLNYRLQQFMSLLHASFLDEYVRADDSRLTYVSNGRTAFLQNSVYIPSVTGDAALTAAGAVRVFGTPRVPDGTGNMQHVFAITTADGIIVEVSRHTPPFGSATAPVSDIPLVGSGYSAVVVAGLVGACSVTIYNRPQWDMGQLVANLETLGDDVFDYLFGAQSVEPYLTWRNLWEQQRAVALRLGAVLLSLARRTDELR